MKRIFTIAAVAALSLGTVSCDRFLDIQPEGKVIPTSTEDYREVLTSAYAKYPAHKSLSALRTDELMLDEYSMDFPNYREIAMWKDSNLDAVTTQFPWVSFYSTIFYLNQTINEGTKTMAAGDEKNQILAEAHALRAYAYFDLVNLYGKPYNAATAASDKGVPISLDIDLEQVLPASSVQQVYDQIHADLAQAENLMVKAKQEQATRYRFSKAALKALEARVALYQRNYDAALTFADAALAIQNELVDLNATATVPSRFDSKESIMSLDYAFNNAVQNVSFASPELIGSYDQANDKRFGLYFEKSGSKYKVKKGGTTDFRVSFRTAELYFIKSEALLKLGQLSQAKDALLTVLAKRYTVAGFTDLQTTVGAMNATDFMKFILDERFREFTAEGHRWFDLRRADQKQITHTVSGMQYVLQPGDVRYTIEIPPSAKVNNPNL
ncbi:MAG: RagB/SusD family nutrient uptake outer membrane protein [Chryseobacterium sp.]|nr:MAG: RagB/SusD family nutrient uptake outer membrane protein [Chryseobacterium sp.]